MNIAARDHDRNSASRGLPAIVIPTGPVYTCPMHSRVRHQGPGTCPTCGMALEPEMPSLEEEDDPTLRDFSRCFWGTLPLTIIVLVMAMVGHRFTFISTEVRTWMEFALSTPVVLWAGWQCFERCVQSIRNRSPNMWTLIGIGVSASFGYSVVANALRLGKKSSRSHHAMP